MRFRQRQDDARAATRRLLAMFAVVVLALAVVLNGLLALVWSAMTGWSGSFPALFFETNTALVLLFVLGGTAVETMRLKSGGGRHVAGWVGGREVVDPRDPHEKRLINVVDEMAIASGLSRPAVFVLEREDSINAFAAGWSQSEAVIAVTRGALERLTRDELQGLVAHEFGHIQQGDLRLNMILLSMVWGLSLVFGYGQALMSADEAGHRSGPSVIVGLVFAAVGWLGWLAGRALQAAVSRQREFLADACAVQFTRSKEGLGGTLRKIWHMSDEHASGMRDARAGMVAAMLLTAPPGWFATHPPLRARVQRLYGRAMTPLPSERMRVPATEMRPAAPVRPGDRLADFGIGVGVGARASDAASTTGISPAPAGALDRGDIGTASDAGRMGAQVAARAKPPSAAGRPGSTAASPPIPRMDSVTAPSRFAQEDRDAMARMALLHGPLERRSALLALLLPPHDGGPIPPGRHAAQLVAWRRESASLGTAERVLADVNALSLAIRLPWFETLLARTAEAPPAEHAALIDSAARVLQPGGGPTALERLTLQIIDLRLAARPHRPHASDAATNGARELKELGMVSVRHVAIVTALLSELLPEAGGSLGAAVSPLPSAGPARAKAEPDRQPPIGWRWYAEVMSEWSDRRGVLPCRRPEDAALADALAGLRGLPWMLRPLMMRLWVAAAAEQGPRDSWPRAFIDGLRLCSVALDCPMHPDVAAAYVELDSSVQRAPGR